MSPHVAIDRSPIGAAKFFESVLCRWGFALRLEHHTPVRGSKYGRAMNGFPGRAQRRNIVCSGGHMAIELEIRAKSKPAFWARNPHIHLRLKSITVQFYFFGECFLYNSPLLVVEHFLIWPPIGPIFRFRCGTKGPVKRNVELCEYFTQFHRQVFIANNSIDDDFAPRTIHVPEIINGKSPTSEILVERKPAAFARR